MKKVDMVMTSIRLYQTQREQLNEYCKKHDLTQSQVIRKGLNMILDGYYLPLDLLGVNKR